MKNLLQLGSSLARSTSAPAGYNQIDDTSEGRLKVHAEEAFRAGIKFKARFIGSLEIPKPHSRVEIVAAMRKVRYEFKARSTKKKKVDIMVSVDGVRVSLRQPKNSKTGAPILQELMHDPINRIFYVSHDSSDLNIWSYIARDAKSAAFKCSVFKTRKDTATNTVRTIGQAFDVVHRINEDDKAHNTDENDNSEENVQVSQKSSPRKSMKLSLKGTPAHCKLEEDSVDSRESSDSARVVLLRQQVELAEHETRALANKIRRMETILSAEQGARVETEVRCEQLLRQNKELISLLSKMLTDNNKGDPFTELALESLNAAKRIADDRVSVGNLMFPETPIHMNSTAVGNKTRPGMSSCPVTPIDPLRNITNTFKDETAFFSSAEATLVEHPLINGDHVLSVNLLNQAPSNQVFHRERLRSAGEMLNSSSLQPRMSPSPRKDKYDPLRTLSRNLSSVGTPSTIQGSRSFSDQLSGMGSFINRPFMALSRRFTSKTHLSDSEEALDDVPLRIE
ncbi:Oidioi.mRNA.OKI2018_I69.XSR.g13737.t1.cds [Oikopleura dioica]|uniref:Oidioi.mRNA.OKI2018_I69.XSR.g13737.t1.cds n=1 Tax=Oikopleura dioica TaxID=34765 RepID=A0ABN7SCG8_OIKDI|nr:Oidioi.mRNA.OKI2018_I69.XSR.g13737.t1.cds [Oikopleura dioica]